jgi:anthranilate synthase component 2
VQFHPESILTESGTDLVRAFCERCANGGES